MILTVFYETLLEDLNYFNVTVLMAIESSVFPLPSEIVVPPAAYMASEGRMYMPLVVFFATLGSVIGASANYIVSYFVGRPLIYRFANSHLGHIFLLNQEKMEKAEAYFDRRGGIATLLGRLLPGIRHLISIPAGLSKMHYGNFVLFTAIGSTIWNSILCFLGWYLHKLVPLSLLNGKVKEYEQPILVGIVVIVMVIIAFFAVKNIRSKNAKKKVNRSEL